MDELQFFSHSKNSIISLRKRLVTSVAILQKDTDFNFSNSFKGVQWILLILLANYIYDLGPLPGYSCMINERLQAVIAEQVRSGKNREISMTKAVVAHEHLFRFAQKFGIVDNDVYDPEYSDSNDPNIVRATLKGKKLFPRDFKPYVVDDVEQTLRRDPTIQDFNSLSSLSISIIEYHKLSVGDVDIGCLKREQGLLSSDAYIELVSGEDQPRESKVFNMQSNERDFPFFCVVKHLLSVSLGKNKIFWFFVVRKLRIGAFGSWFVDSEKLYEFERLLIQPQQLIHRKIVLVEHDLLSNPVSWCVIRLGHGPITYAPWEPTSNFLENGSKDTGSKPFVPRNQFGSVKKGRITEKNLREAATNKDNHSVKKMLTSKITTLTSKVSVAKVSDVKVSSANNKSNAAQTKDEGGSIKKRQAPARKKPSYSYEEIEDEGYGDLSFDQAFLKSAAIDTNSQIIGRSSKKRPMPHDHVDSSPAKKNKK
jgi:hypothetical protein